MSTGSGVVVPLDGSEVAESALPIAALIAKFYGEPVAFVHVLDSEDASSSSHEDARARFAEYANEVAARWAVSDFTVEALQGRPAASILASGSDARCFVVASHGRGGIRSAVIGSVADKIVRGSTKPVFFVPANWRATDDAFRTIIVALDGSTEAEEALTEARNFAASSGGEITLVRAWEMPPPGRWQFSVYPENMSTALQTAADQYVGDIAGENEKQYIGEGAAAVVLRDAATKLGADLVIVGSSGKGLARRLALGSVTERLMHSLEVPLLVIPPAEEHA